MAVRVGAVKFANCKACVAECGVGYIGGSLGAVGAVVQDLRGEYWGYAREEFLCDGGEFVIICLR